LPRALGKEGLSAKKAFAVKAVDGTSLPSAILDKSFAECKSAFAECMGALGKEPTCCVVQPCMDSEVGTLVACMMTASSWLIIK
jgi:hypothetical protein